MNPLASFLLGSWTGVGIIAWLIVWPTAWATGMDVTSISMTALSFVAVRIIENGMPRTPIEMLRGG